MPTGDTTITLAGNLTAAPELRFMAVSREFAISEALVAMNWRQGVPGERRWTLRFAN